MRKIKVASRKSILALKQTQIVIDMLKNKYPNIEFEIVTVNTKGDVNLEKKLSQIGSKGLFTYEIEQLLLESKVDMAVHSLKDMPTEFLDNLQISAYIKRHSPQDIIIFSKDYKNIKDLPLNAKIGTSSLRREVQLKKINPNFNITNIRGNIHTRLEKMTKENFDAIILAKAGLERLNMLKDINYEELDFIPAVSQGCICVETTKTNKEIISIVKSIDDEITRICVNEERDFLRCMGGSCNIAMGAYCTIKSNIYEMIAFTEDNYDIQHKSYYQNIINENNYETYSIINNNQKKINTSNISYHILDDDKILIYAKSNSNSHNNLGINLAQKIKSANPFAKNTKI